ncbi:Methyltransferase domain-containing protein [Lentzea albidocapillata subsp. violacea]|uniref:Methyltransferase domain-containing protein n=1 Tax=Lentzea albidocapillata subsp. violacea TaxID=128104 RepID=A0A1G9T2T9_9PSEU|nr:methyltransferase domain-containing protein [Lentzea albidocapillata]SDM42029.1 Methyltransferase domain-containing protein [Lentzea albidocapillata subsp. violacea]
MSLLDDEALWSSPVVANCEMNRERGLVSYRRELGSDLALRPGAWWVDLCCGSGKALAEAAREDVTITGVDLVDHHVRARRGLRFVVAPVDQWKPTRPVDLVTCVHGLHYVGDKLGLLARAASWLAPAGRFVANFDVASVRRADGTPFGRMLTKALRDNGFRYDTRKRLVSFEGQGRPSLPFAYLGADDRAGPNYTGQPAVDSRYEPL